MRTRQDRVFGPEPDEGLSLNDDGVEIVEYSRRSAVPGRGPEWILQMMWVLPGVALGLPLVRPYLAASGPHVDAAGIMMFCIGLLMCVASGSVCVTYLVWRRGQGWRAYLGLLLILGWAVVEARSVYPVMRSLMSPTRYSPRELDPKTGEPLSR